MAGILIYASSAVQASALAGCAKASGKAVTALAFSADDAQAMMSCGADEVMQVVGDSKRPEDYAKAISDLSENFDALLCISTPTGRELAGLVAGYRDAPLVSDATELSWDGMEVVAERMLYGGKVCQRQVFSGFVVATCGMGIADPAPAGAASITECNLSSDSRVVVISEDPVAKGDNDLERIDRVVCVGNGIAEQVDMDMVRELAEKLDAGIVCTRGIAEERKWLPASTYVGISGLNLQNRLYLSAGVSGAAQHVYGIRNVKTVVAINDDENAPIFDEADYCLVGDLYQILPELIKVL